MLLLGPDGGNLELGSADLKFRSNEGEVSTISFDEIFTCEIVDGYRIKVVYTDLKEQYLKVKTICQGAIDVAMLQKVHDKIKVCPEYVQPAGPDLKKNYL